MLKSDPLNLVRAQGRKSPAPRLLPLAVAVVVTAALSALFLVAPGIDSATSSLFYARGTGFAAASSPMLKFVRSAGLLTSNVTTGVVIVLALARCLVPFRWQPGLILRISPSALLFLATSLALGPGLIVNVILKDHWGRARPFDTILFGGSHLFTPAWEITDGCLRNCSFVSGEGSGSFWFIAFAFIVPAAYRIPVAVTALAWTAVMSLNRIAFGGHFLSDVLIGWGLVLIVILAARDCLLIRWREPIDRTVARLIGRRA